MKSISMIGLAVLVAASSSSTAFGQNSANSTSSTSSARFSDSHSAAEAASGGMAEVKLGQLARQNGSSDAVKELGISNRKSKLREISKWKTNLIATRQAVTTKQQVLRRE